MDYQPQPGQENYPDRQQVPPAQGGRRLNLALVAIPVAMLLVIGVFVLLMLGRGNPGPASNSNDGAGATGTVTETLKEEPKIGSLAPDFELKDVSTGKTVKLSSLRGRPVWINFWATWCPPCREEMPDMEKIYGEYEGKGLAILGLDVQESAQKVKEFTGSLELTWTFMLDEKGDVANLYFANSLPSHFFVDKNGIIQAVHIGGLTNISGTRKVDPRDYLKKIVGP
ncbi:MAG TPA: redoxin domain-containing protein [Chloroflexia bacterium]|nr:redoxin domain-containing protein [Chloroflexia bacterium]